MIRLLSITLVGIALTGCCEETRQSVGVVQKVEFVTTSFNSTDRTVVTTNDRVLMLPGAWSLMLDRELYFVSGRCKGPLWEQ